MGKNNNKKTSSCEMTIGKKKKKSSGPIAVGKKERKRRKRSRVVWFAGVKKRKRASSPSTSSPERRKIIPRFFGELKDMKKLSSNNEVFYLTWDKIMDVVNVIRSRKTPTLETYWHWDEYAVSFYLKMCTCFGVDYQHLEAATPPEQEKPPTQPSVSNEESLKQEKSTQPPTIQMSDEERHLKELSEPSTSYRWLVVGPFEFGRYSCGTRPDLIPYHLYMLVKEAVDIMNTTNDLIDLEIVERKIRFFRYYLHSHLPTGWKYSRDNASSLIAVGYDSTRFCKDWYVPNEDLDEADATDEVDGLLTLRDMANIMSIIHSRKTPTFWNISWFKIRFYCKLCSCIGIDYHRLEAASEDDVCLMNVGY